MSGTLTAPDRAPPREGVAATESRPTSPRLGWPARGIYWIGSVVRLAFPPLPFAVLAFVCLAPLAASMGDGPTMARARGFRPNGRLVRGCGVWAVALLDRRGVVAVHIAGMARLRRDHHRHVAVGRRDDLHAAHCAAHHALAHGGAAPRGLGDAGDFSRVLLGPGVPVVPARARGSDASGASPSS